MNRVENTAASLFPEATGGPLQPLEMNRPAVPILATPAVAWMFVNGMVWGYGAADMVFGGDARTTANDDASLTGGAMSASDLVNARIESIGA